MTKVTTQNCSAVLTSPGEFRRIPVAERPLAEDEIRIRLEGCGVCGSDMAVWKGAPWFDYPLEAGAPGHEGWGHVTEVGADVTDFAIGDRVTALSFHAYAEQDITTADQAIRIPTHLDMPYFPGEPLGCAMNVFARSQVEPGMRVAIVGIGFMGLMLTQLCVATGADVIAISRRYYALEMARQAGAKCVLSYMDKMPKDCDVVIEATGKAEPLQLAAQLTAVRGRLVIAGYHQDGKREIDMQLWNWRGLDVINAHERDPQKYVQGMRAAVDAVQAGHLDLSDVFTPVPLAEIERAFSMAQSRPDGFMKAVVIP